jgi:succinyl-diaminopimelate desuccinylase
MWGGAAGDVADCVDHGISRRSGIALLWHRVVGRGEVGEVVDGVGAVQPAGLDRPAGDLGPDGVQDVIVEDASAGPGRREVPVVEAIDHGGEHDVLAAAKQDHESVTELTRDLVTIPSRGGVDSCDPVLDRLSTWFGQRDLPATVLRDKTGATVGLTCEVTGSGPGPRWVLDACLDTAPFGDEHAWTHPPTRALVHDGWLYGRGSADSKSGAAIFCHIAARLAASRGTLRGSLVLLCDVDEHTGGFGGAKRYFEGPDAPGDVAGVMIGYPGMDKLVVGGRGVYRTTLHVHGVASHSGGSKTAPSAIEKAAHLIRVLSTAELPDGASTEFPLPGKLTVTAVQGGQGYSITPDLCILNVDIRTTPTFDDRAAADLPDAEVARRVDLRMTRQHMVFDDGDSPLVWRVLAESALRWQVGGAEVMREQLHTPRDPRLPGRLRTRRARARLPAGDDRGRQDAGPDRGTEGARRLPRARRGAVLLLRADWIHGADPVGRACLPAGQTERQHAQDALRAWRRGHRRLSHPRGAAPRGHRQHSDDQLTSLGPVRCCVRTALSSVLAWIGLATRPLPTPLTLPRCGTTFSACRCEASR